MFGSNNVMIAQRRLKTVLSQGEGRTVLYWLQEGGKRREWEGGGSREEFEFRNVRGQTVCPRESLTNQHILEITNTEKASDGVKRRRWTWIGHVLRKDPRSDFAVALG